jgi:hypothetical protein
MGGVEHNIVTELDLPDHYNTEIMEISPRQDRIEGCDAFCSLLDELKVDLDESPEHMGFYHNRSSLVKAYGENRMYGLCAPWSEEMLEHKSFDDPIFVTKKHGMVHRMLPCFIVLEKEDVQEPSACTFLWTAKRARNKGMATYLLDFFDVRSVVLPLPEAEPFWSKWFARVQAEIAANEATDVHG